MKTRNKIKFIAGIYGSEGNPDTFAMVEGYQLKHGLAVSAPIVADDFGQCTYKAGWIVYHVATGRTVKTDNGKGYKTPLDALLAAKNVGGLYAKIAARDFTAEIEALPVAECVIGVIGKLRAMPKPKADKVHGLNPAKHGSLIALISDIDNARREAYRTSGQFLPFRFGKATFTVGASLASLNQFRERVLKNKRAFSDAALNA